MENSENLVTPKLDKMLFCILIALLCHVHALEHLRDVTHVEDIVRLCRCGEELFLDSIEELNRGNSEGFAESLDFFRESVELERGQTLENALEVLL